uniref:Uncharacterized protein n=1 Tax=Sinocyclocheilus anshuiensis TaxID=1608454 RepID=A0A671PVX7_9TELE
EKRCSAVCLPRRCLPSMSIAYSRIQSSCVFQEHMLHMQRLEQRARETSMEHWMNPHCFPRCDRNYGYPV